MSERFFFDESDHKGQLKVYSIVRRVQRPKKLLDSKRPKAPPSDFSWPPKKSCQRIAAWLRDSGDKK